MTSTNGQGHTKGPWSYSWETKSRDWAIVTDSAGSIIANVNTETGPDAQSAPATRKMPAEANARLITAAPDLLTLVGRYMAAYPAFRIKPIGEPGSPKRVEQENLMALEDAARAALSRVSGEGR